MDHIWSAVMPAAGYATQAGAGGALVAKHPFAAAGLSIVAIHNAWDITVWRVTKRGM